MTGFGRGSAEVANAASESASSLRILVEINSVNRKTLDVQISAPREWSGYETRFQQWIDGAFQRGRVNLQIKVESTGGDPEAVHLNTSAMAHSLRQFKEFADQQNIEFQPDSRFLLELARSIKDTAGLPDWKSLEAPLKEALQSALADIDSMRLREGAALAEDLKGRIEQLDQLREKIEISARGSTAHYRDALLDRLKQLDLDLDPNDERVLKEIAFFADRSDISEELTRLASHFEQFLDFLTAAEPTGRKMDFLCQEIHRELNTTGSKSNDIEITRHVIEAKNTLERIREQVQNIE
jgi:uncharacterized protein (TIGR00255 family)